MIVNSYLIVITSVTPYLAYIVENDKQEYGHIFVLKEWSDS